MTKTDRYYPCDHCPKQKEFHFHKCPFGKKSFCQTYKLCEAITDMEEAHKDNTSFEEEFIGVITGVLRTHGYIGEIRKTEIVNI